MDTLFAAAFHGDADLVSELIESNPDLDLTNARDGERRSLVYSACRGVQANPLVVKILIEAGASFQLPSAHAQSLPQHAVVQNLKDRLAQVVPDEFVKRLCTILKILKDFYADFQLKNAAGFTALEEFERLNVRGYPWAQEIRSALMQSDFFTIFTSFEGCEEAVSTQNFAECRSYLEQNPLPTLVNLNIAQHLWRPFAADDGCLIVLSGTPLEMYCRNTGAALFRPQCMDILMDMDPSQCIKLRIQQWPNECGGEGGSVQVKWEWLLGGQWRCIEDAEVLSRLKTCRREIDLLPHSYKLGEDFVLRGDGPMDLVPLRWLPSSEADVHDDEGSSRPLPQRLFITGDCALCAQWTARMRTTSVMGSGTTLRRSTWSQTSRSLRRITAEPLCPQL